MLKVGLTHVGPKLGEQLHTFLDSLKVKWSTIHPVRFAEGKEVRSISGCALYLGLCPSTKAVADGCTEILANAHFRDVEIAFRESIFTRSNTPHFEGTGALYLRESNQSDRIFLLTARHVALPPPAHHNQLYARKNTGQRRQEVVIPGSKAYTDALEAMMVKIGRELIFVDTYKRELDALGEAAEGKDAGLAKAKQTIEDVNEFHGEITKNWSTLSQRVLGYVVHAPPNSVGTGPKQLTEDWALIDLNRDKIDWNMFKANVVSLENISAAADFVLKMHPHPEGRPSFKYSVGGLLKVKGVVKEDEIRKPKQFDTNGGRPLESIGCGTGIESFIREYDEYGLKRTSMDVTIHPYSHRDGAFSAPGTHLGLLTGGAGTTDSTDVTYLTPYFWLDERVRLAFPNSYLHRSSLSASTWALGTLVLRSACLFFSLLAHHFEVVSKTLLFNFVLRLHPNISTIVCGNSDTEADEITIKVFGILSRTGIYVA
ncbi:hypothetical protein F5I97DRAFT_1936007 [Phlebopus sp. FC_14]|nr:hypothetical protein F5I97DRAFT_1936007 [Phlebopus sp. FC_14]